MDKKDRLEILLKLAVAEILKEPEQTKEIQEARAFLQKYLSKGQGEVTK